ncbi:hypothetical protein SRABI128_06328 [Microbacterium sp. Bi128]|nr:hypothetical protein SRABI128_06328 [Microbacterium sp. Bi128]
MDAGGDLPGHFEAEAGQLGCLVRVVAEQPQGAGTHCPQHLGRRRVVPLVFAVAQGQIRGVGVQADILQCVGVKLRIQADAAAFLAEVQQEAPLGGNPLHGLPQLRATIAPLAPEYVAGEALAVQPHQRSGTASRRAAPCSASSHSPRASSRCSLPSASPLKVSTSATASNPSGKRSGTKTQLRTAAEGAAAFGVAVVSGARVISGPQVLGNRC